MKILIHMSVVAKYFNNSCKDFVEWLDGWPHSFFITGPDSKHNYTVDLHVDVAKSLSAQGIHFIEVPTASTLHGSSFHTLVIDEVAAATICMRCRGEWCAALDGEFVLGANCMCLNCKRGET